VIVGSLLLIVVATALLVLGLVNGSDAYLVGSIAASLLAAIGLVVGSRHASAARAYAGEEPTSGPAGSGRDEARMGAGHDGDRHGGHEPMAEVIPAIGAGVDERDAREDTQMRRPPVAAQPVIPAQGGAPDLNRAHPGQLLLDDEPGGGAAPDAVGGGAEPDGIDGIDGIDGGAESDAVGRGVEPAESAEPAGVDEPGGVDGVDDEALPDEPVVQQVSAGDAARVGRMSDDVRVVDGRPRYHLAGCVHLLGRDSESLPVHEAVELGFTPCGLCEPDTTLLAATRRA
jgi:hypothetical protein